MYKKLILLVSFILVLSLAGSAFAVDHTWDGGGTGNDWITADNWDLDAVPASSDVVYIGGTAAVEVTTTTIPGQSYPPSANPLRMTDTSSMTITSTGKYWGRANVYVGMSSGDNVTITVQSGGHLSGSKPIILGNSGADSTLNIYGQNDSIHLWLGRNSGGSSVVNYDTTATSLHRDCTVGDAGDGTLNMTSGTLVVEYTGEGDFIIASQSGSTGTVNLDAGTIRCNNFSIGSGNGSMDIKAGKLIVDGDVTTEIQGYIDTGKITAHGSGDAVDYDYNGRNIGKTTVYSILVCGSWGYFEGDINKDCEVDTLDLVELAKQWLDGISEI